MPQSTKTDEICVYCIRARCPLTYRRGRSLLGVIRPSVKRIICAHNGGGVQINYDGAEVC